LSARPAVVPDRWSDVDVPAFFARADVGLFLLDPAGRLLYANPRLHELFAIPEGNRAGWRELERQALAPPLDWRPGDAVVAERRAVGGAAVRVTFIGMHEDESSERPLAILGVVHPVGESGDAWHEPSLAASRALRIESWRREQAEAYGFDLFPANSPVSRRLLRQLRLAARHRDPVAILGEVGTGKRTAAKAIHYRGERSVKGLFTLDCRALPPAAQREFLLAEDGPLAATSGGLVVNHPLALDRELQQRLVDLPAESARLLFIEREPLAVGLADGRLSPEFVEFVQTQAIIVPPLRERAAEIPAFVETALARLRTLRSAPRLVLEEACLPILLEYPWPGNLRELAAVLELAADRSGGDRIMPEHLPERLREPSPADLPRPVRGEEPFPPLDRVLEQVERRLLAASLARFAGNKSKAADFLQISRARFHRRWEQLGLPPASSGPEEPSA